MKVGFVLLSPRHAAIPSTRIAVLNVLPLLPALGIEPSVVFEPAQASETPEMPADLYDRIVAAGCAMVAFQKVRGASVVALVQRLQANGIATAYLVCDLVDVPMAAATAGTVAVTDYLKSLYPADLRPRMHVVHDGIEHPEVIADGAQPRSPPDGGAVRGVLVTSSALTAVPVLRRLPPWLHLTVVGRFAPGTAARWRERRWQMQAMAGMAQRLDFVRFLLNPRIRCVAWSEAAAYRELRAADIGIIPVDTGGRSASADGQSAPMWARKSENRLTLKMAVGLPVVATPIPAYRDVIEQGVNGFLAETPADWQAALAQLRDPDRRRRIGQAARASVLQRFSVELQAERLAAALRAIASSAGTGM